MDFWIRLLTGCMAAAASIGIFMVSFSNQSDSSLLHVSFDATREVLLEIAEAFKKEMRRQGQTVPTVIHSHGSSGSQARAVVAGLPADLVSLAIWPDLDTIVTQGSNEIVDKKWLETPSPWFTTMVFIVRKGNPKKISSWEDLDRPDVKVIIPNPKVSGNGKLAFLSLIGALQANGKSNSDINSYLKNIFSRIPVLESSSRAATLTFATKGLGDVQITYESEAELVLKEGLGLEKVIPDVSIKAPLPLAPINRKGQSTQQKQLAHKYIEYFSSEIAQEIIVKYGFRPTNPAVHNRHYSSFQKPAKFFTVEEVSGSWLKANKELFSQNGLFDRIMAP